MLDLPFYRNDKTGIQCYQVAMQIPIKHFLGRECTLDELDKLTKRRGPFYTYTTQVVPVLHDMGLEVKYFSPVDQKPFLAGESYIREHYGKDAEDYLKVTDMEVMVESVRNMLKYNLFEQRKLTVEEIEDHIRNGHVLIAVIDYYKLVGKVGGYQGHVVVLTGFDSDNFYIHQSGPEDPIPNMKIPRERFMDAWNANGTDNDMVVVYGRR
ncbi:MAG: hypothetical protein KGH78_03885 [Candidatus Micrarchaeota archaeon]|nr:hypothetical protein [Candidatus Micrarchaeota archaeon]